MTPFHKLASRIDLFMEDEENNLYIVSSSKRMGIEQVEVIEKVASEIETILDEVIKELKNMDEIEVEVIQAKLHEMMNLFYSKMNQQGETTK